MVDLTKKKTLSQYDQRAPLADDDLLAYNINSSVGNRVARVPLSQAISQVYSTGQYLVFVDALNDLPAAEDGVITLAANTAYYFTTEVDLEGNRLVCSANTVLTGSSAETSKIISTGLTGAALISSEWTMPMFRIALEAEQVFDLDATANANQALDWYGVNIASDNVGTIKNYTNFVAGLIGFLGASWLVFDGSFDTIAFTDTIFVGSTGTSLSIPSTATITRRFRIAYSAFVVPSGTTGISVDNAASVPVEGYILDTVNFSGSGTYTAGVTYNDNKARWLECRGVINSASLTGYYMTGNATATSIVATGTPVKAAGVTTEMSISQRFTHTDNRATYDGVIARDFKVTVSSTITAGNGHQIGVYIAKNGVPLDDSETYITTNSGGRVENAYCQVITDLDDGDYLELWVGNNTNTTDITVVDMNLIAEALN